ncbi:MAG: serine hydroxymethyltransferase [Rhodospirillales bacterium]|jgi:glycine hydroxymethyltransferase|nr:serine hydroxymethyltransferase [Rhodospirillales bacterium]
MASSWADLGPHRGYFTDDLAAADPEVHAAIEGELRRQQDQIELIASENVVSLASLGALGSVMTNKTVEGYPGRRYYGGAEFADDLESLAIERAKRLFGCAFANVQPHSGSQANQAVYLALLKPGDTILAMALSAGGHLSHGAAPNISGKWLRAVHYGVGADDGLIDYDEVERLAHEHEPRLIIAGGSAYPCVIDFARFGAIAKAAGASLLVDMAHFAGLVAGGVHPDPLPHADVVTATTYKNLRGGRGGLILTNDGDLARRFDSGVFPGVQGSVLLNAVAAKAVCLGEALRPEFKTYAQAVLDNARALAGALTARHVDVVSGGTDTPLMLVDLRARRLTGDAASRCLEEAGLTCNKNAVPFDDQPPSVTSGLRFGVSAATTRGFGVAEFAAIGGLVADVLDGMAGDAAPGTAAEASQKVRALCRDFPIYPDLASCPSS